MRTWSAAVVLASALTMFGIPALRAWAFGAGWFERSSETRRSRSERRPTHGGVVVGVAVVVGALLEGPGDPTFRVAAVALVVGIVAGHRAERGKPPAWAPVAGRVAAALAVPLVGSRAELTGTTAIDVVLTALVVLVVMSGIDTVESTDGTAPAVVAVAAAGLLAVAINADDSSATIFGAVLGAAAGLAAHGWPPGAVRLGRIGAIVIGATLAAGAVELDPSVGAPRSSLVPITALATLALCATLPRLDRRLRRRGLPPHLVLPLATAAGAYSAYALERGRLGPVPAVALTAAPLALVGLIGLFSPTVGARHRRWPRVAFGGAALAVVVAGGGAALSASSARDAMESGRDAAVDALATARSGDLAMAQRRFRVADAHFEDAASALDNPLVRLGDLVPGVAQNLRGARTLADVGSDLSATAIAVAERAGADDLRFADGRFPVEAAAEIGSELTEALATLATATERLRAVDSPYLHEEVRKSLEQVDAEVVSARGSIEVAAEATRLAPALLGADEDKRWLVAVLSSSELRGAGGLIGDFAELRAADGRVEHVRSIPAARMNTATDAETFATVLPSVYARRYGGFHVERFWQNLSVTPDVPTMAGAMAAGFPLTEGGGAVDGVVAIDPMGLARILELTGPVRVSGWPVPITAENAVRILLFDHYQELEGEARVEFQSLVVREVIDALTSGSLPAPSVLAATLAPAVAGGHLRLWSAERDGQALFDRIGAEGALVPPVDGDFVQLVSQNGSESKIDWFLRRSLRYAATVDPATGDLSATATVEVTNLAPAGGIDDYIIGEVGGPVAPGVNRIFVSLLTPHAPVRTRDAAGQPLPVNLSSEKGLNALTVVLEVPPGGTVRFEVDLQGFVPPGHRYRLTVGDQPKRVPDVVEVSVTPSGGWSLVDPAQASVRIEDEGEHVLQAAFREG